MCENFEDSNKGSTETIALKLLGRITDESSTCIFGEEESIFQDPDSLSLGSSSGVSSADDEQDWEFVDYPENEDTTSLPNLLSPSELLQDYHLKKLSPYLLVGAVGRDWKLVYSTSRDGCCLRTLYHKMKGYMSPTILVVHDYNKVFGAMVSCPLRISEKFYGTRDSFLFTFEQEDIEVFHWRENHFIIHSKTDHIAFGDGGEVFGLWMNDTLAHGRSNTCQTYLNECLASTNEFKIRGVEVWGFKD